MSVWTYIKGRKGGAYKTVPDRSHYKDPLDTMEGRLSGNSRKAGDIAWNIAEDIKATLVNEWKAAGLSDNLISLGLAIISVESGFNPDAASNESAAGLGQFMTYDKNGTSRWTKLVNRYNAEHPDDQISIAPWNSNNYIKFWDGSLIDELI